MRIAKLNPQRVHLALNSETKQDAKLDDLVWKLDEIIAHLSKFYHLGQGDLFLTGTPAGVGPVVPGGKIVGRIDDLKPIKLKIGKIK